MEWAFGARLIHVLNSLSCRTIPLGDVGIHRRSGRDEAMSSIHAVVPQFSHQKRVSVGEWISMGAWLAMNPGAQSLQPSPLQPPKRLCARRCGIPWAVGLRCFQAINPYGYHTIHFPKRGSCGVGGKFQGRSAHEQPMCFFTTVVTRISPCRGVSMAVWESIGRGL